MRLEHIGHLTAAFLLFFAPALQAAPADDQYAVATAHYSEARYDLAAEAFRKFVALYEDDSHAPAARFYAGEALVQLKQYAEARKSFESLLTANADSRFAQQALFRSGELAYLLRDYGAAQEALAQFAEKFPDNARLALAGVYLGEIALVQENADEARRQFAKNLENYPQGPLARDAQFGLARAELRSENYAAARKWLEMLAEAPDQKHADQGAYRLGLIAYGQGEYQQALEHWRNFDERFPQSVLRAKVHLACGWSHQRLGEYEEARRHFTEIHNDTRLNVEAKYWTAVTWRAEKQWDQAANVLLEAAQEHPEHNRVAELLYYAADSLQRAGNSKRARQVFVEVAERFGGSTWAQESELGRLNALLAEGDWDAATRLVEQISVTDQNRETLASAVQTIAEQAYKLQDYERAAAMYERMVDDQQDPAQQSLGLSGLAWTRVSQGDLDGAAALFERVLAEHPNSRVAAEAALLRGQIFEEQGQPGAALALYMRLIEEYVTSTQVPRAMLRAGNLYDSLQQNRDAAELYRRLIDEHPDSAEVESAWYGLAWVSEEIGDAAQSLAAFHELYEAFPDSSYWAESAYRVAREAAAQAAWEEANEVLTKLVDSSPGPDVLAHALYLQGRIALKRELWSDVEAPLARLIRELPDSEFTLQAEYTRAEAAFREQRFGDALSLLNPLLGRIAGHTENWVAMIPLRLAQTLAHQREWDRAREVALSISDQFPTFDRQYEVDYLIGRCDSTRGDFTAARNAYQRVIDSSMGGKTETAAMAQWMIGESYFHQRNYQAARAAYLRTEILYGYPHWQASSLLQAGKCNEFLGRYEEAAGLYEKLLKKYPDSEFADEAQRRLRVARHRFNLQR
ncbi:MAG: tetratricopeptide repeat protein [Planctomycetales bacterium]|nr:tetratricopeptide repeat protein [Planctomycetales bacterium]